MHDKQVDVDGVPTEQPLPLALDVDGALLRTDLLQETALAYVRGNPLRIFQIIAWLFRGRATLKQELSARVALNVDDLPVDENLVAYARDADARGREVGIATAADSRLAQAVARRFPFISFVLASDGVRNLKAHEKANALTERFPGGYAYAGDAKSDLKVWRQATTIVLSGASDRVARKARLLGKSVEAEFKSPRLDLRGWLKALRVHQWAKNTLIFVPLILSGRGNQPAEVMDALLAFLAISVLASGTYLVNDLFDLADDRAHWVKRHRAVASGLLPIRHAVALALGLIGSGLLLSASLGLETFALVLVYLCTTLAYSFYLKRLPIVDAFTLASLFTLRLGVGIAAVGAVPSPWLLVFSMFLFASLSLAKRQTEIQRGAAEGRELVNGRGYQSNDAGMVLALGVSTAMVAITIMVLYIMNDVYSAAFYSQPLLLWVFPAALFLWVSRIWLLCHRQQLNDDPVAFAIRDKVSIGLGAAMSVAFLAGWLL